ncbi:hypothetical protein BUALT_Bualt03G0095600 [Buddleja alternifolia]|uniref:Uncharacterized protein n=1 Tax=Buddleja alternifolia TaxID=168488 RepID=A0AAV6Y0T4_9LAMI|nr:hypothetical protein BUALT_Bualt03G0095600 [Buddleja alternifolia]
MMEKENTQNRKRTRDQGDYDYENKESHKDKKSETIISPIDDYLYNEKGYELCDDFGIFDFPWLKEGVIFKGDEYLEPEDTFAPGSCLDEVSATFDDQPCVQNLLDSPAIDGNFNDKCDDDSIWSFKVDDLEPIDRIWSSIINQPLDIGLNKA